MGMEGGEDGIFAFDLVGGGGQEGAGGFLAEDEAGGTGAMSARVREGKKGKGYLASVRK
jgi:hypothetical protein